MGIRILGRNKTQTQADGKIDPDTPGKRGGVSFRVNERDHEGGDHGRGFDQEQGAQHSDDQRTIHL